MCEAKVAFTKQVLFLLDVLSFVNGFKILIRVSRV